MRAYSFLCLLFLSTAAYAQYLQFKPGCQASYTILQTIKGDIEPFDIDSVGKIECDVKILSCDPLTMSYPFDVELTLKKIELYEIDKNDDLLLSIKYNSEREHPVTNSVLAKHFDRLINLPLRFTIDEEFKVKETTEVLEAIEEDLDSPSIVGLFGTTPWTFELFLTQLFQLSGKDLYEGQTFPLNCDKFVNWEDDDIEDFLDTREIHVKESSGAFTVTRVDPTTIQGAWTGNAHVHFTEQWDDDDLDTVSTSATVTANMLWDSSNPLIQQRTVKLLLEASVEEAEGISHAKLNIEQTWKSH